MLPKATLDPADARRAARLGILILLLLGLVSLATAGAFDTPITAADFDTANFSQYVDGNTTQITSLTPSDIVWTTTTSPPDSKQLVFGDNKNPGTRYARVAFSSARTVGAILVRGDVQVSILKSSATYPGSLSSDADWTVCERLTGKTVATSQVNLVGVMSQYPGYALWVVPSAATATRAIRFTRTAPRSDTTYAGHVSGVYVLADRFANLAPQAAVAATLNQPAAARIVNDLADPGSYTNPYEPELRWDSGTPAIPISATNPVTLHLIWPSTVTVRGLCGLGASFAGAEVEYYTGASTTNPREATDAGWTPIAPWTGAQEFASKYLAPNFLDFGGNITTRALRIKFTTPVTAGGSVALTELQALTSLSSSALSTAALANSLTNPPVPITFTLAAAGYVTLAIDDSTGKRVRNLVEAQYFPAGSNTVYWDGIDESVKYDEYFWGYHTGGKLVAPGTYTARGLVRNALTLTYEFSANTGGNPPWFNRDETGGWLADHTPPAATLFLPGSQEIFICSPVPEQGNGLAWTNLNGQLVYGTRSLGEGGYWHGADLLARDTGGSPESGIAAYFVDHGGSNYMELWAVTTGKGGGKRYGYSYPDGTTIDATRPRFGGLAVRNQLAAVSLSQTDQVVLLRVTDGHVYNTVSVANARGLAFDSTGKLIVESGTSVVRYDVPAAADGMTLSNATTLVTGLANPRGLTLDSNNDMYISDWGTSNQVKVYTSAGSLVRVIGTANSGVTAGAYDPTKMVNPTGVTISDNAGTKRLWVAENNYFPKRISVWTLTGTLDTAFYGPSSWGSGPTLDPQDKTRCYSVGWDHTTGMEFGLNWTSGTFSLSRIYYVPSTGTVTLPGSAPQTPIYANSGQQYMTNALNTNPTGAIEVAGVWQMRSNIAVPVAAVGNAHSWALIKESQYDSVWSAYGISKSTTAPVLFAWTDTDNDQQVDANELTLKLFSTGMYTGGVSYDYDLSVVTRGGIQLACGGFTAAGAPIYNAANAANAFTVTYNGGVADGGCQAFEAANNWVVATTAPITGWQNGTQQWTYPNEWMGMEAEGRWNMPLGQTGDIMALTGNCGLPVVANSDIGEIFAINSAEGQLHLMTTDGLFIDTLFKDRRTIPTWNWYKLSSWGCLTSQRGMDVTNVSNGVSTFFTTFNKAADGNFYIFGGLEHDSIVRVDGVSTMARIAPFTVTVSNANQTACADYQITHEQERQQQGLGRETFTIAQPATAPVINGTVGATEYSDWGEIYTSWPGNKDYTATMSAALAVDSTKLYCAVKNVTLTNSGTDLPHLFRTGGGVVIHLGTNAAADPTRTTPVAGDLRLVVSQVGSNVKAMLYKQVATGGTSHDYSNSVRTVTMQDVQDVSSQVTLSGAEFSIPLSVLGFTPVAGNIYLGDVGMLFPKNSNTETYRGEYFNSQAQGVLYDEPYEVQCYPQTWGRLRVGTANAAPVATLQYPPNGAEFYGATSVTLQAGALDTDGTVSKVQFWQCPTQGGSWTLLNEDTSAPYSYTWTVARGNYTVAARAVDNTGNSSVLSKASIKLGDTGTGALGKYYDDTTFSTLMLTRNDVAINYSWGSGSPDGTVGPDTFATRWTGTVTPKYTETYTFTTVSDDGVKLWVNGTQLINAWSDGAQTQSGTIALTAGTAVSLQLDYYDNTGTATVQLQWRSTHQAGEVIPESQLIPTAVSGNTAPTCSLTAPSTGSTMTIPDSVKLIATAADSDQGIAKVEFFANGQKVGEDANSPYLCPWTPVMSGSYTLQARALDKYGVATSSSTSTITVKARPTVTLTAPCNGRYYGASPTVTITADAADLDGTVSKVEFFHSGGTKLGEDTSSPYSYTWSGMGAGNYTLTAVATDNEAYTQRTTTWATVTVASQAEPPTGMAVWLRADNMAFGLTEGAPVTQWLDSSANANHALQTGANSRPLYNELVVNGRPALNFDGADDYLLSNQGTAMTQDVTLFVVAKMDSCAAGDGIYSVRGYERDYFGEDGLAFYQDTGNQAHFMRSYLYKNIDNLGYADVAATQGTDFAIVEVDTQGGANVWKAFMRVNGGTAVEDPYFWGWGGLGQNGYVVSARDVSGICNFGDNTIAEILQYNRGLNTTERQQVETYLKTKYTLGDVTNAAPTVSLTAPTNGVYIIEGTDITLTATASDTDGTVQKVEFFQNGIYLGTDTSSPYSFTWTAPPTAGTYTLEARATDDDTRVTKSTTVSINVVSNLSDPPSGVKVWLKADAGVTKDGSNKVSAWADQSGNSFNAVQTTASQQPTWVSSGIGGQPSLSFTGNNNWSDNANDSKLLVNSISGWSNSAGSLFVVFKPNDNDFTLVHTGGYDVDWERLSQGYASIATFRGTGTLTAYPRNMPTSGSSAQLFEVVSGASSYVAYLNGVADTSQTPSQDWQGALTSLIIGANDHQYMSDYTGYIAEVLLYDRALTTSERQQAENYLYAKYFMNETPTCTLTAPTAGTVYTTVPATVSLTATASDSDGTISKVEFYQGSTLLGTDSTSPYSYDWTNVSAGSYTLKAIAYDDDNATTDSTTVSVRVNAAPSTSITAPTGGATYFAPATVSITGSAADSDGSISKVEFYQGSTLLGTDSTSPYSYSWTNVAVGSYSLTTKAYDNDSVITTSSVVNITVSNASAPVSGMRLWLKADAITGLNNNDPVATWADSSGNGLDATQSTSSYKPLYIASAFNGKPALRFDGSNDTLRCATGTATGAPFSLFVVFKPITNTNNDGIFSLRDGSHDWKGLRGLCFSQGGGSNAYLLRAYDNGASACCQLGSVTIGTGYRYLSMIGATNDCRMYDNGTQVATDTGYNNTTGLTNSEGYDISARMDGGSLQEWGNNEIAEIILYNSALNTTDRQTVESYLYGKYFVANTAPTVSLTSPSNNATFSINGTVNLAATASDSDGSINKVEFYQGSTLLGTDSASPYSYDWTSVAAGTYSLTAKAYDNAGATTASSAVNISVGSAPTCTLTAPTDGTFYASAPATVNMTATASDTDGTVSKVEFYHGSTLLGTDSTSPYSYSWTNVAVGSYALTAKAYDNDGIITTTATINVTVVLPSSGLKLWLKADAITGLNDNDPVATWADSSGNGLDATQSTSSYKPLYIASAINGKPALRFDGSNDTLRCATGTATGAPFSLFVVFKPITNTNNDGIFSLRDGSHDWKGLRGLCFSQGGGSNAYLLRAYDNGASACCQLGSVTIGTGYRYLSMIGATNDCRMYDNGTQVATDTGYDNTTGLTNSEGYDISARMDGGSLQEWGNNEIAEIILYNSALNTTDRQTVESYLKNKYGL